tara:strand:+ start:112 stop:627 length:516 start_codon:yes stop_codon:yes gene_type:complete
MAIDKIQSESINLADTFAFTGTVTGAGGVNTPAFEVTLSGNQSIDNAGTATKITFDTEQIDTDGKFASNKFTPTVAGTYFISLTAAIENGGTADVDIAYASIYKNGSVLTASDARVDFRGNRGRGASVTVNALVVLDSDDFIEGYAFQQASGNTANIMTFGTRMGGYKIIT